VKFSSQATFSIDIAGGRRI